MSRPSPLTPCGLHRLGWARSVPLCFVAMLLILGGIAAASEAATPAPELLIASEDYPEIVRFYRDGLGLPVVEADQDGRIVLDAGGGTRLAIVRSPGVGEASGPGFRLLLPVEDLARARERLRSLHVAFEEPRRSPGGEGLALFFEDPEGRPVAFVPSAVPLADWLAELSAARPQRLEGSSGRIGLMIFGGLYGTWLGVALPVGFGSDNPRVIGGSILAAAPLGVLGAYLWADAVNLSAGGAGVLTLAGIFGTGQGLAWAAVADQDAEDVLLAGAAAGLGSIAATAFLTRDARISPGQAELLHGSAYWGAWYGFVGTEIADVEDGDDAMRTVLISSGVGLGVGIAYALTHDISKTRVRLIQLGGIVGSALGFGAVLLGRVEDSSTAFTIGGLGGLAGMAGAAILTRPPQAGPAGGGARGWLGEAVEADRVGPSLSLSIDRDGTARLSLLRVSF
ncbi:MAG: VOC family protein [Candidatus Eisenbacteria bacterium]